MEAQTLNKKYDKGITRHLIQFCQFARANGLKVGIKETEDCLRAAQAVNIVHLNLLRYALRAVLCSSLQEWLLFDRLFEEFSSSLMEKPDQNLGRQNKDKALTQGREPKIFKLNSEDDTKTNSDKSIPFSAGLEERLKKVDFSEFPESDLKALERLSYNMWNRLLFVKSRRYRMNGVKNKIDIRRTIRSSISRGGNPMELKYRSRKKRRPRLVAILDVSGSMNLYSKFFFCFLYALKNYFRQMESFSLSTRLTRITPIMRSSDFRSVTANLSELTTGWSGGTKLGEGLREFNRDYAGRMLGGNTLFIMMSDGWDTGEPELLARQLYKIKSRVRKLIWLNPLLGQTNYEPITRGMKASLPYIDHFVPAHNIESLELLLDHF